MVGYYYVYYLTIDIFICYRCIFIYLFWNFEDSKMEFNVT